MAMRFICDIDFRMLQVRENEISLRKSSGGTTHLRTLEGTLPTSPQTFYVKGYFVKARNLWTEF